MKSDVMNFGVNGSASLARIAWDSTLISALEGSTLNRNLRFLSGCEPIYSRLPPLAIFLQLIPSQDLIVRRAILAGKYPRRLLSHCPDCAVAQLAAMSITR